MNPPSFAKRHSNPASVMAPTDISGLWTSDTWNMIPFGVALPGVIIMQRFCPSFKMFWPLATSYSSPAREASVCSVAIEESMADGSTVSQAPESMVISMHSQPAWLTVLITRRHDEVALVRMSTCLSSCSTVGKYALNCMVMRSCGRVCSHFDNVSSMVPAYVAQPRTPQDEFSI